MLSFPHTSLIGQLQFAFGTLREKEYFCECSENFRYMTVVLGF